MLKLTTVIISGKEAGMGSKGTLPFCLNIHENVLVFLTFFFNLKRKFPTAL
jgi:hypothetical protein